MTHFATPMTPHIEAHDADLPPPPPPPQSAPRLPPSNKNRCWDWILVPGNMHWAKNRSSFRTYRRAPSRIDNNRVLGVGTVELRVRRAPDDDRPNTLVLKDVLHMPGAVCNGLCLGKYREGNPGDDLEVGGDGEGERCHCQVRSDGREHGEALWYGEEYHGCSRVALWGDPRGCSGLGDRDRAGMSGVDASAEELDTLYTRVRDRSLV